MNKMKTCLFVSIPFIAMTYLTALFINGQIQEGTSLYVFEMAVMNTSKSDSGLLISTTLWNLPKILVSYYLANAIFKSYKHTYAYYYVRSRKPYVWMRKVSIRFGSIACVVCLLKLLIACMYSPSLEYIQMAILEWLYIAFVTIFIFLVLLVSNSEKISMLVIIGLIAGFYTITLTKNMQLLEMVFLYQHSLITCMILSLGIFLQGLLVHQIVKGKEFFY